MGKFDKQSFCQKYFCMALLHAHAQYIYIVYEKNQIISVIAQVQFDFQVFALSKHKQNPT